MSSHMVGDTSNSGGFITKWRGALIGCIAAVLLFSVIGVLSLGEDSAMQQSSGEDAAEAAAAEAGAANTDDSGPADSAAGTSGGNPVDATSSTVQLTGTIRREELTTDQTGMGWSAVVYWLEFDEPMYIRYNSASGDVETERFERIAAFSLEQTLDEANVGLDSIVSDEWQAYVGERVTVAGEVLDTGNAHSFGYASLVDARVV